MSRRSTSGLTLLTATVAAIIGGNEAAGTETSVQNDNGVTGSPCVCFIEGDDVTAWLESPCDGSIVAVQVQWGSVAGNALDFFENSISVRAGDSFPDDLGSVLLMADGVTPATVVLPQLVDGELNEFRFLEATNKTPLDVPVGNGQTFVVSLNILNQSSGQNENFTPSVFADADGCQPGKNSFITGGVGGDACDAGVAGDWMIRAIVDCANNPIPAVSEWGVAIMALLMIGMASVAFGNRRAA